MSQEQGVGGGLVASGGVPVPEPQGARAAVAGAVSGLDGTGRVRFDGQGVALLDLMWGNGLLSGLTLGIYSAWGRARLRRYLWSATSIDGDRLKFHGTGREMFRAWLVIVGIFVGNGVLGAIAGELLGEDSVPVLVLNYLFLVGIGLLVPFAIAGALRYRLSRTSWRGVRFSFAGDAVELLGTCLKGAALTVLTLGLYAPYFASQRYSFTTSNAAYGNRPFRYDGHGRDLFGPFLRAYLLALPTLGLSFLWYAAARERYLRAHTTWEGVRFGSTVTGGRLLGVLLPNALLMIATLGLGLPWAMARMMRFTAGNLVLRGPIDMRLVSESHDRGPALGDQLADALDLGDGLAL